MMNGTERTNDAPRIISVDDHILEPPGLWRTHMPLRLRSVAPTVVRNVDGSSGLPFDAWSYEGKLTPLRQYWASAGIAPDRVAGRAMTFDEIRPGALCPVARLIDMDANGVEASVCFPNLFVRFCGQRFLESNDKKTALACVRAYNDFLASEWQPAGDHRLIGVGILPLWDVALAAQEVRRLAANGIHHVSFPEIPSQLGLPSLGSGEWDTLFRSCVESSTVVHVHVGSSPKNSPPHDAVSPAVVIANLYTASSVSLADLITSGTLARFPALRVSLAESQAGWIPFLLQQLDSLWRSGFGFDNRAGRALALPPSEYFRAQVF